MRIDGLALSPASATTVPVTECTKNYIFSAGALLFFKVEKTAKETHLGRLSLTHSMPRALFLEVIRLCAFYEAPCSLNLEI